jgi:hypothetical protein
MQAEVDSTGDTVRILLTGDVPEAKEHRLVQELAIAPRDDDSTLFTFVKDVKADSRGRMWVFDPRANTLFLFGPDGALLRRIGGRGSGPGEFTNASGMTVLGDSGFAVWDGQNARITLFDFSGDFRTTWPNPGGLTTFAGLMVDRLGRLYIKWMFPRLGGTDGEVELGLMRLRPGGAFGDTLRPPTMNIPRNSYLARNGARSSSTESSHAPNGHWAWHPDGHFVVVNGATGEILTARADGRPVIIRRVFSQVPLIEAERDVEQAQITASMRRIDPTWTWHGPSLPKFKAPLLGVLVARDGRTWVQVAVPSEEIPAAEITTPTDSTVPVVRHRTVLVYEVYSPAGAFLGRVRLPARAKLVDADGDRIWAVVRDADDVQSVVRFKVGPAFK